MGIWNGIVRGLTWWNGQTLGTQLHTWWAGRPVGEDGEGNRYYESGDRVRRWVIFSGEMDASRVPPEWHGWLHHTFDAPPNRVPLKRKSWEKPHVPNLTGSPAAYAPPGSIRRTTPVARRDYEAWSPE